MTEVNIGPDDDNEAKLLGQALRNLRKRAGLSQVQAADAGDFNSAEAYRVYEAGTAPSIFKPGVQFKLATAVRSSLAELLAERDKLAGRVVHPFRVISNQEPEGMEIAGRVQAGAWLLVDDLSQAQPRTYPAARDPRFPHAKQWLEEVVGDSVDLLGITDGDLIHCVDATDIGYSPRTGDVVEVQRSRRGGRERELTVKRIEAGPEGWQLVGRSSNPRWNVPLQLGEGLDEGEEYEVRIRALVINAIKRLS